MPLVLVAIAFVLFTLLLVWMASARNRGDRASSEHVTESDTVWPTAVTSESNRALGGAGGDSSSSSSSLVSLLSPEYSASSRIDDIKAAIQQSQEGKTVRHESTCHWRTLANKLIANDIALRNAFDEWHRTLALLKAEATANDKIEKRRRKSRSSPPPCCQLFGDSPRHTIHEPSPTVQELVRPLRPVEAVTGHVGVEMAQPVVQSTRPLVVDANRLSSAEPQYQSQPRVGEERSTRSILQHPGLEDDAAVNQKSSIQKIHHGKPHQPRVIPSQAYSEAPVTHLILRDSATGIQIIPAAEPFDITDDPNATTTSSAFGVVSESPTLPKPVTIAKIDRSSTVMGEPEERSECGQAKPSRVRPTAERIILKDSENVGKRSLFFSPKVFIGQPPEEDERKPHHAGSPDDEAGPKKKRAVTAEDGEKSENLASFDHSKLPVESGELTHSLPPPYSVAMHGNAGELGTKQSDRDTEKPVLAYHPKQPVEPLRLSTKLPPPYSAVVHSENGQLVTEKPLELDSVDNPVEPAESDSSAPKFPSAVSAVADTENNDAVVDEPLEENRDGKISSREVTVGPIFYARPPLQDADSKVIDSLGSESHGTTRANDNAVSVPPSSADGPKSEIPCPPRRTLIQGSDAPSRVKVDSPFPEPPDLVEHDIPNVNSLSVSPTSEDGPKSEIPCATRSVQQLDSTAVSIAKDDSPFPEPPKLVEYGLANYASMSVSPAPEDELGSPPSIPSTLFTQESPLAQTKQDIIQPESDAATSSDVSTPSTILLVDDSKGQRGPAYVSSGDEPILVMASPGRRQRTYSEPNAVAGQIDFGAETAAQCADLTKEEADHRPNAPLLSIAPQPVVESQGQPLANIEPECLAPKLQITLTPPQALQQRDAPLHHVEPFPENEPFAPLQLDINKQDAAPSLVNTHAPEKNEITKTEVEVVNAEAPSRREIDKRDAEIDLRSVPPIPHLTRVKDELVSGHAPALQQMETNKPDAMELDVPLIRIFNYQGKEVSDVPPEDLATLDPSAPIAPPLPLWATPSVSNISDDKTESAPTDIPVPIRPSALSKQEYEDAPRLQIRLRKASLASSKIERDVSSHAPCSLISSSNPDATSVTYEPEATEPAAYAMQSHSQQTHENESESGLPKHDQSEGELVDLLQGSSSTLSSKTDQAKDFERGRNDIIGWASPKVLGNAYSRNDENIVTTDHDKPPQSLRFGDSGTFLSVRTGRTPTFVETQSAPLLNVTFRSGEDPSAFPYMDSVEHHSQSTRTSTPNSCVDSDLRVNDELAVYQSPTAEDGKPGRNDDNVPSFCVRFLPPTFAKSGIDVCDYETMRTAPDSNVLMDSPMAEKGFGEVSNHMLAAIAESDRKVTTETSIEKQDKLSTRERHSGFIEECPWSGVDVFHAVPDSQSIPKSRESAEADDRVEELKNERIVENDVRYFDIREAEKTEVFNRIQDSPSSLKAREDLGLATHSFGRGGRVLVLNEPEDLAVNEFTFKVIQQALARSLVPCGASCSPGYSAEVDELLESGPGETPENRSGFLSVRQEHHESSETQPAGKKADSESAPEDYATVASQESGRNKSCPSLRFRFHSEHLDWTQSSAGQCSPVVNPEGSGFEGTTQSEDYRRVRLPLGQVINGRPVLKLLFLPRVQAQLVGPDRSTVRVVDSLQIVSPALPRSKPESFSDVDSPSYQQTAILRLEKEPQMAMPSKDIQLLARSSEEKCFSVPQTQPQQEASGHPEPQDGKQDLQVTQVLEKIAKFGRQPPSCYIRFKEPSVRPANAKLPHPTHPRAAALDPESSLHHGYLEECPMAWRGPIAVPDPGGAEANAISIRQVVDDLLRSVYEPPNLFLRFVGKAAQPVSSREQAPTSPCSNPLLLNQNQQEHLSRQESNAYATLPTIDEGRQGTDAVEDAQSGVVIVDFATRDELIQLTTRGRNPELHLRFVEGEGNRDASLSSMEEEDPVHFVSADEPWINRARGSPTSWNSLALGTVPQNLQDAEMTYAVSQTPTPKSSDLHRVRSALDLHRVKRTKSLRSVTSEAGDAPLIRIRFCLPPETKQQAFEPYPVEDDSNQRSISRLSPSVSYSTISAGVLPLTPSSRHYSDRNSVSTYAEMSSVDEFSLAESFLERCSVDSYWVHTATSRSPSAVGMTESEPRVGFRTMARNAPCLKISLKESLQGRFL